MAHTNGVKKFLFVVMYENSEIIDILRSDHEPDADEITQAIEPETMFDPERDKVIRFNEDNIINLKPRPNKGHA